MDPKIKLEGEITVLQELIDGLIKNSISGNFSDPGEDKDYWQLEALRDELEEKEQLLLSLIIIPKKLISLSSADIREIEEAILDLNSLKNDLKILWESEDLSNEKLLSSIVYKYRLYERYFATCDEYANLGALRSARGIVYSDPSEIKYFFNERYSYWVNDQNGNPGVLTKRLLELKSVD